MDIYRLGIDLAKQNFELCGVDKNGKVVLRRSLKRSALITFVERLERTEICMESCSGSNFWARKFLAMGHEVKLIAAQHVEPFVKSQKNDRNDALAITEAAARPTMCFVSMKQSWQQDIQSVHRVRSRVVRGLTEIRNQMRGLLAEYGVVIGEGVREFKKKLPLILEDASNELTSDFRDLMRDLWSEYQDKEERRAKYDKQIEAIAKNNEVCRKLAAMPGIGPMSSTAYVAHIGDAGFYKNGRQAAASLGLVPRQNSSGGKQVLLGITKRGDSYLRSLLIHGARAQVHAAKKKSKESATPYQLKIQSMLEKKHVNKVVVAVANRNARVMLAMMKTKEEYRAA